MEKNSTSSFSEPKNHESITKTLKVTKTGYRNEYVPKVNIQGKYLEAFGFYKNDQVNIVVTENRILIEKIIRE